MTTSRQTSRKPVSDFIVLVQFELICQMLAKFSGVKSERTVFTLRKRKRNCVVSTYFIKWTREIRKFHVVVVLRRLRNVQKSAMQVQSCCFANLNLLLFAVLVAVAVTSPLYLFDIFITSI